MVNIISKFPQMGTTIFSQISAMANQYNAVNLGQGFPNFMANSYLLERASVHTQEGMNQYAPLQGMEALRLSIKKIHQLEYSSDIDHDSEVTVTSGATEAIFCAIASIVHSGDEVIVFDPSYDSYVPNIQLCGARAVRINLEKDFSIDWRKVQSKITTKTKCIILNSPHNPSGKTLTSQDLDGLWNIIEDKNIFIISDEVYQHIIFDNKKHLSPFCDERMRERTFAISSFGKTFHVTGWKIGYCVAPESLTKEFRKIHQYITFCSPANFQLALSELIDQRYGEITNLSAFYQRKRDQFQNGLEKSNFILLSSEGSFFQLVDYSAIDDCGDVEFCQKLIKNHGVAGIPISVFYEKPPEQKIIRFCFAKTTETLGKGLEILAQL